MKNNLDPPFLRAYIQDRIRLFAPDYTLFHSLNLALILSVRCVNVEVRMAVVLCSCLYRLCTRSMLGISMFGD